MGIVPAPGVNSSRRLAVAGALGVARDLGWVRFRLPENRRQIPRDVFGSGVVAGTARFGFELGTGVRTYMSASAPYLLAILVVLLGNAAWLIVVPMALGFGIGRSVGPAFHASGWSSDWRGLMKRIAAELPQLVRLRLRYCSRCIRGAHGRQLALSPWPPNPRCSRTIGSGPGWSVEQAAWRLGVSIRDYREIEAGARSRTGLAPGRL